MPLASKAKACYTTNDATDEANALIECRSRQEWVLAHSLLLAGDYPQNTSDMY